MTSPHNSDDNTSSDVDTSMFNPDGFRRRVSVTIDAIPDEVYDVVSDISRTGEWSPVCKATWWKERADGTKPTEPEVGAWFVGHNETPKRTWETESVVTAAERPKVFSWAVNGGVVEWGYEIKPAGDNGSTLTETWEVTQEGFRFFINKYGDDAEAELNERRDAALEGIPATVKTIKSIVEKEATHDAS